MLPLDWMPGPTPADERAAKHRIEARVPLRGGVRPRLPLERPAGRDRAQARQGDGRPPQRLGLARLRPERVHGLPLARRPRAVRRLRGQALRGAPGLPRRARPPRALRAPEPAAGQARHRRRPRDGRCSGSPRAWSRGPGRRPPPRLPPSPSRAATDRLPARRAAAGAARRRAVEDAEPARARGAHRSASERHELAGRAARARPLEGLRHPGHATRTSRAGTPRSGPSGDGYTIVDLGSTNGIEVDGKRVKELALEDGSRFTLGSTEIAFSREAH